MEVLYSLDENSIPQYSESNISVSSDKNYFAIGSTKGTIYVFNTMTGKVTLNNLITLIYSSKNQSIINLLQTSRQFNGDRIILRYMQQILQGL